MNVFGNKIYIMIVIHLEQLTLYMCRLLRRASTLRRPSSTTLHPQLQLQQAAPDVTSEKSDQAANVVQFQSHILSQTHQLQVATDILLGIDGVSL